MKLRISCKSCKRSFSPNIRGADRARIVEKFGNEIYVQCQKCGSSVPGFMPTISSLIILIGGSIGMFAYYGAYLTKVNNGYAIAGLIGFLALPAIIFLFISNHEQKKCDDFNSYRI